MQAPFADPLSGLETPGKTLPLVGRATEMQAVRVLLDTVSLDLPAGARALTISGETGVGKTRLLAEIYREARARGLRVLEGRTYEAGSMFPYLPFIEALRPVVRSSTPEQLRNYVGLATALVGEQEKHDKETAHMVGAISLPGAPLVAGLARLFPELLQTLHVTSEAEVLTPEQEKFRLLDAVATLLERMALEQPVLLGIDNLQWADSASLELTLYLTVRLCSSRVALVGVTRPPGARSDRMEVNDEVVTTNAVAAAAKVLGDLVRQGLLMLLPLGPLSEDAAAQHLQAILPGSLSPLLAQTLLTRAEGNPFFLEELVRMLMLNRHLAVRAGSWRVMGAIDIKLPESITLAVEQRLEGLRAACRELLRVASLFGRTFPLLALGQVLKDSENTIQFLLDEAMQAMVIAKMPAADTNEEQRAGEGENRLDSFSLKQAAFSQLVHPGYMFCQGIVQEVLSAEVPAQRARLLHASIGAALEASYENAASDHAAELARHYVLGGEKSAALRWSLVAGEDAARQQAHREAISHFRLALKLLEQAGQPQAGNAQAGQPPAGEPRAGHPQGVPLHFGVPSPAQIHVAIGESWFKLGELEQAAHAFEQALEQLRQPNGEAGQPQAGNAEPGQLPAGHPQGVPLHFAPPLEVAHVNRVLADVYRLQGKYELALAHLQVARAALDRDTREEGNAASGQVTSATWFPGRSFPGAGNMLTLQRVNTTERILFLQAQATLDILLKREQEAESALWQSYQLATEVGDKSSQAFALHLVGWLRGWGEQVDEAIRLQKQAHELYVALGDPFRAVLGDQGLGIIYQALGETGQARLYTLRGFERAHRYGARRMLGWLHWNQGVIALTVGNWAESESHLQAALQEADAHNDVRLKPMVLQAQAELYFRRGNWGEAEQLFLTSIQTGANTEWYPGVIALYGHFLAVTGRRKAARTQLDRAAAFPEPPGFGGDYYIPFLAEGYLHLGATEKTATYLERIRVLHGFMYYGNAVDRILGVVATLAGNWEMAAQAFADGLLLCQRAGNYPEEAAILYEQARATLVQSATHAGHLQETLERVHNLCSRARELFLQYGMQRSVDLVDTLEEGVRQLQRDEAGLLVRQQDTEAFRQAGQEQLSQQGYYLDLSLTRRELEVLRLVAEGHTDREVAETLVISPRTVNRHLSNIFVKLDVPGRAAAVAYAIRQGLV